MKDKSRDKAMLAEVKNVSQYKDEPHRRWFLSEKIDLTVWYDEAENIVGFQLCYQKNQEQKALTWNQESGYAHQTIDDGEVEPFQHKETPILVPDGVFEQNKIVKIFEHEATRLEQYLASFVLDKLKEYSN